ncbi:SH3 and FCH domain-containing protein [Hibiscus syriacus]|uniref:SH3 and FCH domain-containing protein n=1 Tax=Hibiscus syriacus TaxID=106335 RepID=A0A6A2YTW5_HIBSY|nr:uncharacterized protein LOC120156588 [Hibiscus syriacus]KAE8682884.1 SH3 and FCH domain-containing protein [Hibiscus syriacus]
MANHLLTFCPTGFNACAIPGYLKPHSDRWKSPTVSSSSTWWFAPLFGVSSDPDYIDSDKDTELKKSRRGELETEAGQKSTIARFLPGRLTEDKARQLRMMTTSTSSFHDVMYHSAIASRLDSDFKDNSSP